jgi:SAM-dependent methyltransferase
MGDVTDPYLSWKDWRDNSFGRYSAREASYYEAETQISGPDVRVLEIGFGNGSFIGWAHAKGAEVFGVEKADILVARAREFLDEGRVFGSVNDQALADLAGTFSHIVAFDVIEHIDQSQLPGFFKDLRKLLASGGCVILRFPNGDSPFGRLYQHGDPTHVSTLGQGKIRFLAGEAGLELDSIREPRRSSTGFIVTRGIKRMLRTIGRFIIERTIGYLYFEGRVIPLDPNYIACLRRPANDR